jgi:diguanylate cyclase (GGDEF)-like protein
MYFAVAANYLFDGALLLVYAAIGVTPLTTAAVFTAMGIGQVVVTLALSEIGFNDRFRDHYLTVLQSVAGISVAVVAVAIAPELGVLFVCLLFVVLSFGALRLTALQTALVWSFAAASLCVLFLLRQVSIDLPMGTMAERTLSLIAVVSALARFSAMGLYGSDLRKKFYDRGKELAEANLRIAELAELDELTGALNRRSIMAALEAEIARVRPDAPCSVALIDLDHFKTINDCFGHPVGDEVLRTFAMNVAANLRSTDWFGRYGGEEFLLVMPGVGEAGAMAALERLRQIIEGVDWPAIAPQMGLTLSAGVCEAAGRLATDVILARADRALYRAKDEGRNRVVADGVRITMAAPPLQPGLPVLSLAPEATIASDI